MTVTFTWSTPGPKTITVTATNLAGTVTGTHVITIQPCYTLTVSINPSGAGSVSANPPPNCANGTKYVTGTVVTLTATANTGYTFANWSGDVSGLSSSVTVTMNGDRTATANFTASSRIYLPLILK